jgi:hypothetical protein
MIVPVLTGQAAYDTPSLPLGIGFTNSVPVSIRRDPSSQRARKQCCVIALLGSRYLTVTYRLPEPWS